MEQMYERWLENPASVHASCGLPPGQAFQMPPTAGGAKVVFISHAKSTSAQPLSPVGTQQLQDSIRATLLARAWQIRGHTQADLDPLKRTVIPVIPDLDYKTHGFKDSDLEREVFVGDNNGFGIQKGARWAQLKHVYSGTIGVEYTHIQDADQKRWIVDRFENRDLAKETSNDTRIKTLRHLAEADLLELFLATKYATTKRFGLDGCLETLVSKGAELGCDNYIIGMAHRGRINVMANVMNKPLEAIFHEFEGGNLADAEGAGKTLSGDVKYHLGTSVDSKTDSGLNVHLSLVANPSHLEAVAPVVEGKARAKQFFKGDKERKTVMCLQIHGDAAFAGQGVVYETLDLSGLDSYTTGGSVHIVVNNQIGFTTDPVNSRGPREYCTDVGKCNNAPIFHVNADDPEAVAWVFALAAEFRQTFHRDIVIDLIGYRRFGHNENDQPLYTQPLMYKAISKQPRCLDLYKNKLMASQVITDKDWEEMKNQIWERYEAGHRAGKEYKPKIGDWLESRWEGFQGLQQQARIKMTGVPMEVLKKYGAQLTELPENFQVHRGIKKILEQKAESITTGEKVDWATGEALAFATLLAEGNHVRLSGQDVERGTFSHRHAVVHDQVTGQKWCFLKNLDTNQHGFSISNSSLSEFAVMGFELGYSMENPNSLVLWEAQFGDFANGAQIIIDQFLSSGEQKWMRQCGLTILLPHGFEGQGPEHSSSRLERWLQLSDSDPDDNSMESTEQLKYHNWAVIYPSTSANYFHALRRQVHRSYRKPLIVLTPKYYLKHALTSSNLDEFDDQGTDTGYTLVYPELEPATLLPPEQIRKVVFCSGKVYFDLLQARRSKQIKDVALVRIEQLAPFPFDCVRDQAALYPNAQVVWAQEEQKNAGAWNWIAPHIEKACGKRPAYSGRKSLAAAATGSSQQHEREFQKLMTETLEQ